MSGDVPEDLSGRVFGKLTARALGERTPKGKVRWLCDCECGGTALVRPANLKDGRSRSCGCARSDRTHWKHPIYGRWLAMRHRCRNPLAPEWESYGGRGIRVCDRWDSFEDFLADVGERPPGTSLDRIDNNGDYEPGNVRWATKAEQMANRRPKIAWPSSMIIDPKATSWWEVRMKMSNGYFMLYAGPFLVEQAAHLCIEQIAAPGREVAVVKVDLWSKVTL